MNGRAAISCVLASLLSPAWASAGGRPLSTEAGSRVRVSVGADTRIVGRLVAYDQHALRLEIDGDRPPLIVPADTVLKLEVSGGKPSAGTWVAAGVLIGAAAGFGVAAMTGSDGCTLPQGCRLDLDLGGVERVMGALLGGFAGGVVGAVSSRERWHPAERRVDLNVRPSLAAAAGGRHGRVAGIAATLRVRF